MQNSFVATSNRTSLNGAGLASGKAAASLTQRTLSPRQRGPLFSVNILHDNTTAILLNVTNCQLSRDNVIIFS